jgi:hypothetical protein
LQNDRVVRWLVAIAAACAPGCFYVEPINQRPSADIVRDTLTPPTRGGAAFSVHAVWSDPDGDDVTLAWTASACTAGGCSTEPFASGTQAIFGFVAPQAAEVTGILIVLDATDAHGAHARPLQQLLVDVADQPPTIGLQIDGRLWRHAYPVGLPITVRAQTNDLDGDNVSLIWKPPYASGTDMAMSKWIDGSDPTVKSFTPDVPGSPWAIEVDADDGAGGVTVGTPPLGEEVLVAADRPPCLGTTDPQLTTATLVLDQARRFSVFTVDDDLDIYPAPPAGSLLGAATFHWSLATPASSGAFTALATDENNVVIDPADYAPGDVLDVRVEIQDRTPRAITCDPSLPQCSIIADPTCLQRQTWHLEVR